MPTPPHRLAPLAVVILALLDEAPMYPYRMQQLILERGKGELVNVRHRASLYQAITRLERDGLIEVHDVTRAENRPERTSYRLTEPGRVALHQWLRAMLGQPAAEYPEFPVALSCLHLLEPTVVREDLIRRTEQLETARQDLEAVIGEHEGAVPRLFLLELEYLRAMAEAELAWARGVTADLDAGRLHWSPDLIRAELPPAAEEDEP